MSELLTLEELRKLPDDVMAVDEQCVYFLWKDDELLYVGASTQVSHRISRHVRDRRFRCGSNGVHIDFNRYTFLVVPDRRDLWPLESAYQQHYDPPCNVVSHQRRRY